MTEKLIDTIRDEVYQNTLTPWIAMRHLRRAIATGDEAARLYLEELVLDSRGMRFSVVSVFSAASGQVLASGDRECLLLHNIGPNNIYLTFDGDTASTTTGLMLAADDVLEFGNTSAPWAKHDPLGFALPVPNGQINGIADNGIAKLAILQG